MKSRFRVLGIHDNHNSSVCLLEEGVIVSAIQEERISREKNTCAFPFGALKAILKQQNLSLDEIDLVVFGSKHNPKSASKEQLLRDYKSTSNPLRYFIYSFVKRTPLFSIYSSHSLKRRIKILDELGVPGKKTRFIEHHLSHAAAAYYGSHYDVESEKVLVFTLDGGGDGLCATVSVGENGKLRRISSTPEGNSIGNLYALTTFILGFTPLEHEYKLMGMAPYSNREHTLSLERELLSLIEVNGLAFRYNGMRNTLYSYQVLKEIYRLQRFDHICGAIQNAAEELVVKWIKNGIRKTGIRKIALGGGVFMNVKLNKRIMELEEVKDIFIFPSCGDESTAIGAAYQAYSEYCTQHENEIKNQPISDLYLGENFTDNQVKSALEESRINYDKCNNVERTVSELLAENKIVARFKGRAEWGARALGNRSILANASNFLIPRDINKAIKMRDFWMPFAPSILDEVQHKYLVNPKGIGAQYMMLAFDTTDRRGDIIAAVHPFDNTVRPQVVYREDSKEYCNLIKYYYNLTGFGGLLNTSFNLHGEPIVNSPQDAIKTYLTSGLDYMAIGDYLVTKEGSTKSLTPLMH